MQDFFFILDRFCRAESESTPSFFFSCIAERARDLVGQLLGNRKRSETGSKNLNHLLQKARFTFQALLEFDRRVCGSVNSMHDLGQGDALHCCSCPVHRAQNFNGFTGPISRAVSVTGVRAHITWKWHWQCCQSRQEDGQRVRLFAHVSGHPWWDENLFFARRLLKFI